jgi:hypothetical protein
MADEEAAQQEEQPEEENLKPDIDILEAGLMTMNEAREKMGLGAMPDGDLTLPQYRNKYPELFAMNNMANGDGLAQSMLSEVNKAAGIKTQAPQQFGKKAPGEEGKEGEEQEPKEEGEKPQNGDKEEPEPNAEEPPKDESDEGPEVTIEDEE